MNMKFTLCSHMDGMNSVLRSFGKVNPLAPISIPICSHVPGHEQCKRTGTQNANDRLKWFLMLCVCCEAILFHSLSKLLVIPGGQWYYCFLILWRGTLIHITSTIWCHCCMRSKVRAFPDQTTCMGSGCKWIKDIYFLSNTTTIWSVWKNYKSERTTN
jgi:hypothetical protein